MLTHSKHAVNPPSPSLHNSQLDLSSSINLRRRRRRDVAEQLLARAQALPPHERSLVHAIYARGLSVADIARAAHTSVHSQRSTLNRILRRLAAPHFAIVLTLKHTWPSTMRRIAEACYIRGLTLRAAARELDLSIHTTRRYRDAIAAIVAAAQFNPLSHPSPPTSPAPTPAPPRATPSPAPIQHHLFLHTSHPSNASLQHVA